MKILLSVIIPFYNSEKYFKRCLETLEAQLCDKRIELILIDDGSTDGSKNIAELFQRKNHTQVTILHQKNSGSGAARNSAIHHCKGIFLGFVDSDDWIEPDMFTQMLDTALKQNSDVVICNFFKIHENGNKRDIKYMPTGKDGIIPIEQKSFIFESGFSPWNKIIKKKLIIENKLYFAEGILHQDVAILPAVLAKANKIINISKPLYNHYARQGSSVRTWDKNIYDIFKALDYLKSKSPSLYKDELEYLTIKELFYHVLPAQYHSSKEYEQFRKFTVSYFLENHPSWKNNLYVNKYGLVHYLYLKMILKGFSWPIALTARFKNQSWSNLWTRKL